MKAKNFLASLDAIRTKVRSVHGMGDNSITPDGEIVKELEVLVNTAKNVTVRKRVIEVLEDEEGNVIGTADSEGNAIATSHMTALQTEGTAHAAEGGEGTAAEGEEIKVTPLPRDPRPVHPVEVEAADAKSVADADLLSTVGD